MRLGAGPGRTRDDHLEIAAQLYALAALARRSADLAEIVGADALGERDRGYLVFARALEEELVTQARREARTLEDTLARAWRAASVLPARELTMVTEAALSERYEGGRLASTPAR